MDKGPLITYGVTPIKSPCYRCPDRSATCHRVGVCEKWGKYLKEREQNRAKILDNRIRYRRSAFNPRKN